MKHFDDNIEGLRGIAALSVIYSHIFVFDKLIDPVYQHDKNFWLLSFGHVSVLIFFILSGYVIGLTNKPGIFSKELALLYLKKRLIRLYPIYAFAIIATLLIVPEYNIKKVLSNSIFFQYALTESLKGNVVLWTLNFEVLYYLLFIPILYFKPNIKVLILACFILSWTGIFFPLVPDLIVDYSIGYTFWLSGLYIAWYTPKESTDNALISSSAIISFILLMIATNLFAPIKIFLIQMGLFEGNQMRIININDLAFLPVCLSLFALSAQRKIPFAKLLQIGAYLIPLGILVMLYALGKNFTTYSVVATILSFAALIIRFVHIRGNLLYCFTFVGSVSYALYVIHMPIAHLLQKITFFSGSGLSFSIRAVLLVVLTYLAAYILEKKIQPYIKVILQPKKVKEIA